MPLFALLFFFYFTSINAQEFIPSIIILEEVNISENSQSLTPQDFMKIVKEDTTFYKGFKHLRFYPHSYSSNLDILDKKGRVKANIYREGKHISHKGNAWILNDTLSQFGKIYKRNGEYRYYTAEAFDIVFFPKDTFSVSLKINKTESKGRNQDKNVRDAKTIGFTVGSSDTDQKKGSLSSKLAIFDTTMQKYYDYIIGQEIYNGVECYTFTCQLKDSLSRKDVKQTLVKKITSYFDKTNFNVLYRDYFFEYKNLFIKLDMKISVSMQYVNGIHVPVEISYHGFWDLPFFKAERVNFRLFLFNYKV